MGYNGFDYPYKALSPVTNTTKTFKNIDDVYGELLNCYQELEDKKIKNVSETIYIEHFFFCNTSELLDKKVQQRIKEYNYCKAFNTAPYRSLKDTPAEVVDDFMEIEYIMNNIYKEKSNVH